MKFLIIAILLLTPTLVLARAQSGTCATEGIDSIKSSAEVGVFLAGICDECWDLGDCGLNDFFTVVVNVGNYILSIAAAAVFLVYILGGFFWIIARGDKGYVDKGKKWIKNASVGLAIILCAYVAVVTLRSVITGQTETENYVICDNTEETDGQPCAPNSTCDGFSCVISD
jgi:amino acid transporter